jgi:hypothetical protein
MIARPERRMGSIAPHTCWVMDEPFQAQHGVKIAIINDVMSVDVMFAMGYHTSVWLARVFENPHQVARDSHHKLFCLICFIVLSRRERAKRHGDGMDRRRFGNTYFAF